MTSTVETGSEQAADARAEDDGHDASDSGHASGEHAPTAQALAGALPEPVCKVLQDNGCLTCHQGHGHGGAPMPLQRAADFSAQATDGQAYGSKVLARIVDTRRPMPPSSTGRPLPPAEDVAVLKQWIDAGMHGVQGKVCEEGAAPVQGPAWARAPWPADECEYVMTVGAHEKNGTPFADDPAGFPIPAQETTYHCFYEKVPWGDKPVQALAVRARLEEDDDKQFVHHMQLSSLGPNDNVSLLGAPRPTRGGQHTPCANPNGATVGTWGPGALNPVTVPDDVGVQMPSGSNAYLELQVHYHNPQKAAGKRSRVVFDVCATTKMRPNAAGIHTLGYENSFDAALGSLLGPAFTPSLDNQGNGVATGVCTAKKRTRVLSIAPHMHELGRHAKVEILRTSGAVEVIHDAPYSFQDQTSYIYEDLWLEVGDKVRTTCVWDTSRKIVFGFTSQDEMCFFSTLSYPVGALAGIGPEKGFASGDLSCAGAMR